jgi:hypothetical protein
MEIIGVGQQREPTALLQLKVPRGIFSPPRREQPENGPRHPYPDSYYSSTRPGPGSSLRGITAPPPGKHAGRPRVRSHYFYTRKSWSPADSLLSSLGSQKRISHISLTRGFGRIRGDCVAMHLASRAIARFPTRAIQGRKKHARPFSAPGKLTHLQAYEHPCGTPGTLPRPTQHTPMSRSASSRPAFPFLGAALLLAIVAAVCAVFFSAYLPAVFLASLGLISAHLGMPTTEPVRVQARAFRPHHDC